MDNNEWKTYSIIRWRISYICYKKIFIKKNKGTTSSKVAAENKVKATKTSKSKSTDKTASDTLSSIKKLAKNYNPYSESSKETIKKVNQSLDNMKNGSSLYYTSIERSTSYTSGGSTSHLSTSTIEYRKISNNNFHTVNNNTIGKKSYSNMDMTTKLLYNNINNWSTTKSGANNNIKKEKEKYSSEANKTRHFDAFGNNW